MNPLSDLPEGLGFRLVQDMDTMEFFSQLSDAQKQHVVSYIQSSATGDEAKERTAYAINMLKEHRTDFF